MQFCNICNSLILHNSCTNKKCDNHIKGTELATFQQIQYIKDLQDKLKDDAVYNFIDMTKQEASKVINNLKQEVLE